MLLKKYGIDPKVFWGKDLKALVTNGYDPTLGFLKLFLDSIGSGKPLGPLTNNDLATFGATLDAHFHEGLPAFFDDIRSIVAEFKVITVEFYIVSGGLQALILGSDIVKKHFSAVYGCVLGESGQPPVLTHIKRAINFTEKTRYLFEISKGIPPAKSEKNPYLVNKDIPKPKRRIPFKNMIYVGDGLTDIPCFSMLKSQRGTCFGVFDPTDQAKAKRALHEFLKPQRVITMNSPKYGATDDLGSLIRAAVASICNRIVFEHGTAEDDETNGE